MPRRLQVSIYVNATSADYDARNRFLSLEVLVGMRTISKHAIWCNKLKDCRHVAQIFFSYDL